MTTPGEALRSLLAPLVNDKFYPMKAPQNATLPYCVYFEIDSHAERHMSGAGGLSQARYQINTYAAGYLVMRVIADHIRMRVDGYRGNAALNGTTFNFRSIAIEDSGDLSVDVQEGSDAAIYSYRQDLVCWFMQPVPTFA